VIASPHAASEHQPKRRSIAAGLWLALLFAYGVPCTVAAKAEDGSAAWLRYARVEHPAQYQQIPSQIVVLEDNPVSHAAAEELRRGLSSELGRSFSVISNLTGAPALVLSTQESLPRALEISPQNKLQSEGFAIGFVRGEDSSNLILEGGSPAAELYAAFRLLENIETEKTIEEKDAPEATLRWTDEWDNLNGSIERGYAGRSIFFEGGHVRPDLSRASAYARLLASIGINGCNVNNVNADLDLLTTEHIHEFIRLANAFRPWGIKLALSVDISSPQTVGGLPTFDPLDPRVIRWWTQKVDEIYTLIPDLGGLTIKADSEGRAGPSKYGRTPADAANVLARALKPHGGVVLYRAFVYDHHLDWRDPKADRARAGYDNFAKYDSQFETNVIVQIKHGPIDFQAREPVSPLFAALRHTSQAMELETTQEYTGQQRHMVFLPSMWQWVLNTDLRVNDKPSLVADIVTGKRFGQPLGGFVSVTNVGMDANWLHHPMAMANLYGFGKLAWHPGADLDQIMQAWSRLTWGNDPQITETVTGMLRTSWQTYESYTGPNGMGTLTDIIGVHYGPGIESAESNGWGQWFRAEPSGIGMDRTTATGTGYIGQYPKKLAARYESLTTCPDNLLLFFHHVPYDYRLLSGKTLTQSIYDSHYAGALAAGEYVGQWERLKKKIDPQRYALVDSLLTYQAGHAIVWRDAINTWFHKASGIPDAQGRIGNDPNRIEAEDMVADGYKPIAITPAETASGGKAVICTQASGCSLSTTLHHPAGKYNIAVQYFDLRTGVSRYSLWVNNMQTAGWQASDALPPGAIHTRMDGHTSTRFTARGVVLHPGDHLVLRGTPDFADPAVEAEHRTTGGTPSRPSEDRRELAPVDYIEIGPTGSVTPQ
jgi:alpha-glucuronidase